MLIPRRRQGPDFRPLASPTILAHTASQTRYCALALYYVGKTKADLLHDDAGRVVVFENKAQAQDVAELLSEGRETIWDATQETACYQPLDTRLGKCNRAVIVTDYDLYHLPAGHPVPSETRGREWRHHVLQGHWLRGLTGVS